MTIEIIHSINCAFSLAAVFCLDEQGLFAALGQLPGLLEAYNKIDDDNGYAKLQCRTLCVRVAAITTSSTT